MLSRLLGLRDPSLPLPVPHEPKFESDVLDSEVFYTVALDRGRQTTMRSSLRLWLPFRVSPVRHHETVRDSRWNRAASSLPRFLSLQRLSVTRSHLTPTLPVSPVMLRPQDFSTSRRFTPLTTFRACFIPVPLMGFDPPRPLSSPGAVRPLERRAPLGFSLHSVEEVAPPGTHTLGKAHRWDWCLARFPNDSCLLGLFLLRGFLLLAVE